MNCTRGPNNCDNSTCVQLFKRCGTGYASGATTLHSWYCENDIIRNSYPSGAGVSCYTSSQACANAPNICGPSNTPCWNSPSFCASGIAAGVPEATYVCPYDLPNGALPNGAGKLCYSSEAAWCAVFSEAPAAAPHAPLSSRFADHFPSPPPPPLRLARL